MLVEDGAMSNRCEKCGAVERHEMLGREAE